VGLIIRDTLFTERHRNRRKTFFHQPIIANDSNFDESGRGKLGDVDGACGETAEDIAAVKVAKGKRDSPRLRAFPLHVRPSTMRVRNHWNDPLITICDPRQN
jgi:hypothetical protein